MAINKTLRFSWGHIIAFVALIFISYISFMGIIYLGDHNYINYAYRLLGITDSVNNNYFIAVLGVIIIDLLLVLFFIIPQLLKGTERKFRIRIWFERILIIVSPFVFYFVMSSYSHFWTVFKNRQQIETTFVESVKTTKEMFDSYELYANERIKEYHRKLTKSKTNTVTKNNKIEALKLQLLDENYNSLKNAAYEWIDKASGATVWNVFMIGNIDEIEKAIDRWNTTLNSFSSKIMSDEPAKVKAFSDSDPSVIKAKENLNSLRSVYTTKEDPSIPAIVVGVLLYILLLFPYIIQGRNSKSTFRLIGSEGNSYTSKHKKSKKNSKINCSKDEITFSMEDTSSSNEGDYGSFTM